MSLETRIKQLSEHIALLFKTFTVELDKKQGKNWIFYASQWQINPTLNTNIAGGKVYNYTLNNVTIYRFVPTIYNPTQDAFYSNFDGINLTNLITKRG